MEVSVVSCILVLIIVLVITPSLVNGQECGPTKQTIGWSQPNNVPIERRAKMAYKCQYPITYGGPRCPDPEQIELTDEDGNNIPAQIRLKTPYKLVQNAPDALTPSRLTPSMN